MHDVRCSNCGYDLSSIHVEDGPRAPCPRCGSESRHFARHLTGTVRVFASLGVKHKRPGFKRPLLEIVTGKLRGGDGRIVNKDRVIDRLSDRYRERVTTEDGEVIVDKDENLRAHR